MNKKVVLLAIGIVAVLMVACKAKNVGNEAVDTDITNRETQADTTTDATTDTQNTNENQTQTDNTETSNADETTDLQNNNESNDSDQKRNLNYKDVDIKIPSIHED